MRVNMNRITITKALLYLEKIWDLYIPAVGISAICRWSDKSEESDLCSSCQFVSSFPQSGKKVFGLDFVLAEGISPTLKHDWLPVKSSQPTVARRSLSSERTK